ncbi:hypothetical protein ABZZ74_51280 [Streptomyces sp. NPDC006476]|uniref:hypothetical protein n=1 Tax=Streptomyces sp. NPDC006476 TaxID=3157175 RepID=UPI0033B43871
MAVSPSSPQPNGQSRPLRAAARVGAGIGGIGTLAASLAGAPWGMVLTLALAALVVVLVQSVIDGLIPQDSADRLTWWNSYWTYRQRRGRPGTRPHLRPPARPHVPAEAEEPTRVVGATR